MTTACSRACASRASGSRYYVEELALQNTACCESHPTKSYKALGCLGPKCSDLGLPPNTLLTKELDEGAGLQVFQPAKTILFPIMTIRTRRQGDDEREVRGIRDGDPTHTNVRHIDRERSTFKVHRLNGTFC